MNFAAFVSTVAAGVTSALPTPAARANIVANGEFESPGIGNALYVTLSRGQSTIDSWGVCASASSSTTRFEFASNVDGNIGPLVDLVTVQAVSEASGASMRGSGLSGSLAWRSRDARKQRRT